MAKEETKAKKGGYSADDIYVLEGLEPVRKRPGMYIGSTGIDGLHHLVWEVFDNSRDEAMGGHAAEVEVAILPGDVIRVVDDGRGIPVEIHQKTKVSALETVMTTLHAGGKFGGESYKISGGLHGVGVSVVNALSTWLKVEVHRDGGKFFQEYKIGKPKDKVKKIGSSKRHGTIVSFFPDRSIFSETKFNFQTIIDHLREQAYLVKKLKIKIIDAREYEGKIDTENAFYIEELNLPVPSYSFYFEGGLLSLVKHLNRDEDILHDNIFYLEKEQDGIIVETAFQYITDITGKEISFANNIHTKEGGTHLTGFRSALTRVLNDYAKKNNFFKKDSGDSLSGEDVREGLTLVLSVKLREPQFEGQTKAKLGSTEARTATETVISIALLDFLEENPQDAKKIIERCILSQKARKAAKAARETVLRKGILEGLTLPGKLADCSSRRPEDSELYIVEGDSAGGCFSGDTKVALAGGRNLSFKELIEEHKQGKENYCYTIQKDGRVGIELIKYPRRTKQNTEVIKVILDNNEEIICTPDHKFMLVDRSYKEVRDLIVTDSLMPLYKKFSKIEGRITIEGYEMVFDSLDKKWVFTHMLSDDYNLRNGVYMKSDGDARHHIDFDKLNNSPENIKRMAREDHMQLHRDMAEKTILREDIKEKAKLAHQTKKYKEKVRKIMSTPKMREMLSERAKKQWESGEYKEFMVQKFLNFYNSDAEFRAKNNKLLNEMQVKYWSSEENRDKQSERVRLFFENHPEFRKEYSEKSKQQWQDADLLIWRKEKTKEQWTEEFRNKRKKAYNQTYLRKGLSFMRIIYDKQGAINKALYEKSRSLQNDKSVIKYDTICRRFFGGDEAMLKEAVLNFNHKIKKIVKMKEKIDVYDIEVPGTHNFALASGVFVHNSGKQGRDRRFQAILPLRGKILNIERARLDRMLESQEIRSLVIALGTAIAEEFDVSKIRYHKVIIMTDADVDGAHIRTLLLTLFFRHFPEIIEKGYLYIAQPPLYRIQSGKKVEYAYKEEQKELIIKKIKTDKEAAKKEKAAKKKAEEETELEVEGFGEATPAFAESFGEAMEEIGEKIAGINIQRYKGLGEMNPEQLWETTMSPENRTLGKVTVEDAAEADKVFDILMGKDVMSRKRFIQSHAKNVKNLDI